MKTVLVFVRDLTGGGMESTLATLIPQINRQEFKVKLCCVCPQGPFLAGLTDWVLDPASTLPGRVAAASLGRVFERKWLYRVGLLATLPMTWLHLRAMIRRENPDVVMTCSAVWSGVFFLSAVTFRRRRFRWFVREGSNIASGLEAMRFYQRWPLYIATVVPFRLADGVLVASKGCRVAFMRYFGLKRGKVRVIHDPVDMEAVLGMVPEEISVSKDIVFMGRLEKVKNVDILIRAFAMSGLSSDGFRLVLYGVGSQSGRLKSLAADLSLGDSAVFEGFASRPLEKIQKARVLVLPSKREGFGRVVLEAMAVGTPVLVSDCDYGPKDLVMRGRCGMVVKRNCPSSLAEGLVRLLGDAELSQRNVVAGLERAKQYDVGAISRDYEAAFMDL